MIKFVGMSSEHSTLPKQLCDSSEKSEVFCTYAWIETDEIDTSKLPDFYDGRIPVTVVDYKPKRSKRTEFVICDPVWQWIEEARPDEIQKWIERNIEKLNQLFIDFANNNGYLTK